MPESNSLPSNDAALPPPPDDRTPAIAVDNLSYSYRSHQALRGVTFTVMRKSIHGFVGPNGAGKTTALKVIATLLRADTGRVRVFGNDIELAYRDVRRRIGFMPDHFSMYRQMTVFEYLDFFAAAYGMDVAERDRIITDVLTLTDMEGRRNDFIRALSRGMQQRVSLARVLVHDPDLLLLDEPASGLDPRARIELMEILKELRRMGKTVFISSHILTELAMLCDSFTIIDRGRIRYTGPKRGLLSKDGQTRTFVLTLAQPHPGAVAALAKIAGVLEVKTADDENVCTVTLDGEKVGINDLLRVVMDGGAQVASFQEDGSQLNQAFMDLTEPGVPK